MGVCCSTTRPRPGVVPTIITKHTKAESELNVTSPEVDKLIDLKKYFDSNQTGMHRRVKDCYECILANNYEAITDLNFKFVKLGEEGMSSLSVVLPFFPKLTSLRLWKARFGCEGSVHLAKALFRMPGLRLLSLEDNDIGVVGLQKLAEALKSLANLEELFIHLNHLGPEGGAILSAVVGSLHNLRSMTSDENGIEDQAASDLIRSLGRSSASLRLLGLSFNRLTDSTATVLLRTLNDFPQLKKVMLNGNSLSPCIRENLLCDGPQVSFNF